MNGGKVVWIFRGIIIALTNGKCAFYILEHLSPESFCFFVPFTKKIAIEESGLFQDSLIVYVKD